MSCVCQCFIGIVGLFASSEISALEIGATSVAIRGGLGVTSWHKMGVLTEVPWPLSAVLKVDIGRFVRLHTKYAVQISNTPHQVTSGAGAAFTVVGRNACHKGGAELKIPAILEGGIVTGKISDVGDGYTDTIHWMILGPSTGIDFTWWFPKRIGIWFAINVGYLFKIADLGSDYSGYVDTDNTVGYMDLVMLLGAAF